ncbi:MAG: glycosyltransferase family 2 protein [Patescibacteria group bacterium]
MVKNQNIFSKTWIVIPGFNEEKYLASVLKKVTKKTTNVIYVDDGSNDSSSEIAKQFPIHVLRHEINLGKGGALQTGCDYAFYQLGAEAIIMMDGDDQHDAEEIPLFRKRLEEGSQLVLGARSLFGSMPLIRKVGNAFTSAIMVLLFFRYIPDILSGYKAFTKKTYKQIKWEANDYSVELEIAANITKKKLDFSLVSIETIYHDMDRGMNILDAIKIVGKIMLLRLGI